MVLGPVRGEARAHAGAEARRQPPAAAVVWHDLECGAYTADLELWLELAADMDTAASPASGPERASVLDIGAGTGRVALALGRAGHRVTALELDAELLQELRARAGGLDVSLVRADARTFELERRDFALCIAPMQTLQLLGGATGRLEFLRRARAHLIDGGMLACAIVTDVDAFDCDAGDLGPSAETTRIAGVRYTSRATRVLVDSRVVRIERERSIVSSQPARTRGSASEQNVVELDRVDLAQLHHEGHAAGLTPAGSRLIEATDEHAGSVVVMFRA